MCMWVSFVYLFFLIYCVLCFWIPLVNQSSNQGGKRNRRKEIAEWSCVKRETDYKVATSPPSLYSLKDSPFNYRQRICTHWLAWYCFKSETDWALKKNLVNYVYRGGRSSQTFLSCAAKEDGSWVRPWMIQVIRVCLPWLIILIICQAKGGGREGRN